MCACGELWQAQGLVCKSQREPSSLPCLLHHMAAPVMAETTNANETTVKEQVAQALVLANIMRTKVTTIMIIITIKRNH